MRRLATDLADRHGKLVRSGGGGGHAVRGLAHGGSHAGCLGRSLFGGRGHRACGRLELRGRRSHAIDHFPDCRLEALSETDHFLTAFPSQRLAFLRNVFELTGRLQKDLERTGEIADFIVPAGRRDVNVLVALGKPRCHRGHALERG